MGSKTLFNKNYQQQPRLPSGANQRRRTREAIDPLTEQAIKNTLSVSGTGESHLPLNQADFILTVNSFDTTKVPHKNNNAEGAAAANNNSDLRKEDLQQLQLDPNAHGAIKRVTDKMKVIRDNIVTNCGNDVKFVTEDSTTVNETDATNHIIYPFGKQELRPHSSSKTTSKEVSSTGFFGNTTTKTVSETISSMDGWTCTWGMKIRIVSSGDDAAFTMNVAKVLDTLYACEAITVFSLHYSLDQASKDKLCEKVRADAIEDATNKAKQLVASLNKTNNNSSSTSTLCLGRLKTFVETSEGVSRGSTNEQGRILHYRRNKQGGIFGSGSDNDDDDVVDHTTVSVSKKGFRNKKNAFGEDVEKYSLTLSCDFELLQSNESDDNNNNATSSTIGHFDVFGASNNNNKQSPTTTTTTTTHLRSSISVYPKDDKDESAMTATQCAQQMADRQKALSDTLAPLILTEDSSCELIFSKIPRFTAYTKKSFSATAELCIIVKQQEQQGQQHQSSNLRWALLYEQLYNFGYTNINVEHTKTKRNDNGGDENEEKTEDSSSSSSAFTEVACTEAWTMAKRYADRLNLEIEGVYAIEDFSSASLDDSSSSATTIRQDLPGARPGPGAIAFTAAGGQIQQQQQQQGNSILSSISSSSSANGAQYYHNNPVGAESSDLPGRGFYRVSFKCVAKK